MSKIPENVLNKKLYLQVKKESAKRFKQPTSAYRSMWIVKTYKERGGKYKGKKSVQNTRKWLKEEWVQVEPYLTEKGKKIVCGHGDNPKACRPLHRIDKTTPLTLDELLKIHSKKRLVSLACKKSKDMNGRLDWRRGVFKPSS